MSRINSLKLLLQTTLSATCRQGFQLFSIPIRQTLLRLIMCYLTGLGGELIGSVQVETNTALNTSDHVPVSAVLRLAPKLVEPEKVVIQCKPRWDRCDQENFVKSVSDWLKPFDSFHISNSKELDILYPLGHLCAVLKLATDVSIPNHKNSAKLKNRKHRPWSEKIHEAIKRSRLEWWEWRKAGSPRDLNNPYLTRMKEAKKCLRREQRREAASR